MNKNRTYDRIVKRFPNFTNELTNELIRGLISNRKSASTRDLHFLLTQRKSISHVRKLTARNYLTFEYVPAV